MGEEPPATPAELREQARDLLAAVADEADDGRRGWLTAQLAALETTFEVLAGEQLSYRELVERCYCAQPNLAADEVFEAAHRLLDETLPGNGSVRDRYEAWLSTQRVPPDLLVAGLEALAADLRERTRQRFGLPENEHAEFELVQGKLWSGFADYSGRFRTRIEINTDLPVWSFRLLELVAHEVYPGHHTEHVLKELELVRGRGRLEPQVFLYSTPQALVSEGIAQLALEALLGEDAERVGAECLRPLGIAYDDETAAVVREAKERLLRVTTNIALLLDEGELSAEGARAYARRWMLESDEHVDKAMKTLLQAPWRPYGSCYPEGLDVCRRFVDGDPARFKRLLTEQLTTADLLPRVRR